MAKNNAKPLETAQTTSTEDAKAANAPERVKMRNTRPGNGQIGAEANPLAKDVATWEANGWERV